MKILRRPGCQSSAGRRSLPALTALALTLVLVGTACTKPSSAGAGGLADIGRRPHTTVGALIFSPPRDAREVSPNDPVMVATKYSDAHLTRVTLTRDGGDAIAGSLTTDGFIASGSLQPDARYTITATASLPANSSSGSPSPSGAGGSNEQTVTLTFATATTPKIVSVTPTVVGPGDATIVTLDRPAREVKVDGPATAQLGPGGTTISLYPQGYRPGASFPVSISVTSMAGVTGGPQSTRFAARGGPTLTTSFNDGDHNLGVASPLIVGTGQPPADPADFAAHFSVTADAASAIPPSTPPAAPVTVSGTAEPNPCSQYSAPAVTTLGVSTSWISPTRLQFKPATPDGYWPPNTTISVSGNVEGLFTRDGSAYGAPLNRSFSTGDKRAIDVDLSTQTLTACRSGVLANQFPVSTGVRGKDTHTGSYYIYQRISDAEMKSSESEFAPGYYDVKHVPWTQYFHNGEALHGAYWHNNFGHPMSHGCVNVSTPTRNASWPGAAPNAEYLWSFDNLGDPVIVHGTTP
ncbi:MAG TPA: L,D-transpeptidase family protein [Actinomycetota bacterium]